MDCAEDKSVVFFYPQKAEMHSYPAKLITVKIHCTVHISEEYVLTVQQASQMKRQLTNPSSSKG